MVLVAFESYFAQGAEGVATGFWARGGEAGR
jgi:hypothetical protein